MGQACRGARQFSGEVKVIYSGDSGGGRDAKRRGESASIFTLRNNNGMEVRLCDLGAAITAIKVPDQYGQFEDVILASENVDALKNNSNFLGVTVGRQCARTGGAKFTLNGKSYDLTCNDGGKNHLHGGKIGFHHAQWKGQPGCDSRGKFVVFTYNSPDGEDGYPGDMQAKVRYTLTESNRLEINMRATCTKDCPVNMTNHAYFNLNGHRAGSEGGTGIATHRIVIHAKKHVETGPDLVATGKFLEAKGATDFHRPALLRPKLKEMEGDTATNGGFDHTYLISDKLAFDAEIKAEIDSLKQPVDAEFASEKKIRLAAEVAAGRNGRRMRVYTDRQAMHFYTGNFLDGTSKGKGGIKYMKHGGFCLEAEDLPNAINLHHKKGVEKEFVPNIVGPSTDPYKGVIVFEFLCDMLQLPPT
eukprot:CAMPEP_0114516580 /NCGR_PEP_ID=MMETSP0109-20121206/17410_1 /TAXON_ID=29199 /ORGANISM="Chlorarachnion reptans, Strain CCCM449" /LENGTH=415 /DNA_ID=CAMNT_0001696991 /DNA_START=13 /DNA_END=1260 /DNA_ORIENTATION=+